MRFDIIAIAVGLMALAVAGISSVGTKAPIMGPEITKELTKSVMPLPKPVPTRDPASVPPAEQNPAIPAVAVEEDLWKVWTPETKPAEAHDLGKWIKVLDVDKAKLVAEPYRCDDPACKKLSAQIFKWQRTRVLANAKAPTVTPEVNPPSQIVLQAVQQNSQEIVQQVSQIEQKQSQLAEISYNAPLTIPYGQVTNYRLLISLPKLVDTGDFKDISGPLVSHTIKVSPYMKAVLKGPKDLVDIEYQGASQCQSISPEEKPSWDWAVTPKTTRPFTLQAFIWDVSKNCDDPAPRVRKVDSFPIKVSVTVKDQILMAAASLNATLLAIFGLVTAGGGAVAVFRRKKK